MNISIPDDLRETMREFDDDMNWSAIAYEAFIDAILEKDPSNKACRAMKEAAKLRAEARALIQKASELTKQ